MKALETIRNLFWPPATESKYQVKRVAGVVVLLAVLCFAIKIVGG